MLRKRKKKKDSNQNNPTRVRNSVGMGPKWLYLKIKLNKTISI